MMRSVMMEVCQFKQLAVAWQRRTVLAVHAAAVLNLTVGEGSMVTASYRCKLGVVIVKQ